MITVTGVDSVVGGQSLVGVCRMTSMSRPLWAIRRSADLRTGLPAVGVARISSTASSESRHESRQTRSVIRSAPFTTFMEDEDAPAGGAAGNVAGRHVMLIAWAGPAQIASKSSAASASRMRRAAATDMPANDNLLAVSQEVVGYVPRATLPGDDADVFQHAALVRLGEDGLDG